MIDDFTSDTSKWAFTGEANVSGKVKIDPNAPSVMTLFCEDCGEPVGWIGGAPRSIGKIFRAEFECPCGAVTEFTSERGEK